MEHGASLTSSMSAAKPPGTNYNLNVEIGSDGSVRVIPPAGAANSPATNAPAH